MPLPDISELKSYSDELYRYMNDLVMEFIERTGYQSGDPSLKEFMNKMYDAFAAKGLYL